MTVKGREVQVEQAIVRNPLTLSADATVDQAIALMSANNQSCNFFCDTDAELSLQLDHAQNSCILITQDQKLIGILTERDLIKLCGQFCDKDSRSLAQNFREMAIAEVMVYPVYSLLEWEFTDILVPLSRFHRYNIRHLPLVNDRGEVVGLLTHESLRQLLRPMDMLRLRRVREAMITKVICASPTDSLVHITSLMSSQNVSSVVIVEPLLSDDQSHGDLHELNPVGIITEGDIVQYLSLGLDLNNTLAHEVMSYPLVKAAADDTLWEVRGIMQERMVNHVVVTQSQRALAGIISQSDLLKTVQPTEIYKLVTLLESKMSTLERENRQLRQQTWFQSQSRSEDISDSQQAEESLQQLVEGMAAQIGENILPTLAAYISKTLEVRCVFVTRFRGNSLELMISWIDGQICPPITVPLAYSPCVNVLHEGTYLCPEALQENFVDCDLIRNLKMTSYFGTAIINSKNETIGSLCILDDQPLRNIKKVTTMLRVFAARVSAEVERQEALNALHQLNQELESRVEQRTHELREVNHQLTLQIQERQKLIMLVEQSNAELARTNLELACATRLKDEFLASMSHEFRTPLNAILGMSDGLINGVFGEVSPIQKRALTVVEKGGQHLLELINGILEVAQIGSGKLTLDPSLVMVDDLCQSSINLVQRLADQKNMRVYLSVQPELVPITIDRRRMQQALINLLNNAIKFTPTGGEVRLDVQVVAIANINLAPDSDLRKGCTHALAFSVTDTGIGIASEDMDKLFQAFVQLDGSYSRQQSGTGLGLILVKQIIKLHRGDITVTSQAGQGSCFTIFLPYAN